MRKTERILLVDDERPLLDSIVRQLHRRFSLVTATSGEEGLRLLQEDPGICVVVSDYRMPDMDGIAFLRQVKKQFPAIIRIMLSGHADVHTAIEAVNRGNIFRFLTKPCGMDELSETLERAVRQYQLVHHEKELLNKTVKGSISMLIELLSLSNSRAYSSGYRIKDLVSQLAREFGLKPLWQYEIAALISQIGCVSVPADILKKVHDGTPLSPREQAIFSAHPGIGARLVRRIPRLEKVAEIIAHQFDPPADQSPEDEGTSDTKKGSQILRTALAYDRLVFQGMSHDEAVHRLYSSGEHHDPDILALLKSAPPQKRTGKTTLRLHFDELLPGMIAAEDIVARNGTLIIEKGQEISWPVLQSLHNFIEHIGIREPIKVWSTEAE